MASAAAWTEALAMAREWEEANGEAPPEWLVEDWATMVVARILKTPVEKCVVCHVAFTENGCRCVPGFI
jgi:hypothetical protein